MLLQHPFDDGALARAAPWNASFDDFNGLFREAKVPEALAEAATISENRGSSGAPKPVIRAPRPARR